jgi:excisionase family DNA binding protein
MEFITINDAAKIASISPRTVRRAISRGDVPAYHVGAQLRLIRSDVETSLTSRRVVTIRQR